MTRRLASKSRRLSPTVCAIMYAEGEEIFYYLALYNDNHVMPPMPEGVEEGILKGLYKFKAGATGKKVKAHIFGSGPIIQSALKAQELLESMASAPTFGARRATGLLPHRCDPLPALEHAAPDGKAEAIPTSNKFLRRRRARSFPSPTTSASWLIRSRRSTRAGCSRWARMVLVAATRANACVAFSKWTRVHRHRDALRACAQRRNRT